MDFFESNVEVLMKDGSISRYTSADTDLIHQHNKLINEFNELNAAHDEMCKANIITKVNKSKSKVKLESKLEILENRIDDLQLNVKDIKPIINALTAMHKAVARMTI